MAQIVKNLPAMQETGFDLWVGQSPWRRDWLTIPAFWPGEFRGLYSPWVTKSWIQPSSFHVADETMRARE